jgi:SNF2 family DNA or RNA helicase
MTDLAELPRDGFDGDLAAYAPLLAVLVRNEAAEERRSRLVDAALGVRARPGFDTFVSLERLRFTPYPHQLAAAEVALRRMRGRAILADEVGLGKTIEAGLVLSELSARGLARRVLVLCPSGLVAQWQEELERKFVLPTRLVGARAGAESTQAAPPVFVASIPTARRQPLAGELAAIDWDLVIVDEAHRMKNPATASAKLLRSLRARYLLLLTATPIENRLSDLFNLASLVAPGLLGTAAEFRSRHGSDAVTTPKRLDALRTKTAEVMVRHRRSEVALMLPQRLAETRVVTPDDEEAALYRALAERVRAEGHGAPASRAMALRAVLRLAGSHPSAVAPSVEKLGWADLAAHATRISSRPSAKAVALLEALTRAEGEKVIVFTAFRQTQDSLAAHLAERGIPAAIYHGSLARAEKERAITAFSAHTPVLVSTEAAGEGRNLQFCHRMVNFDLPWNPMQIEQRLGRLHRIGQEHDVVVVNLAARHTIEEQILSVLEQKVNLFELVVGELDMVLGRIEDDYDFESSVFAAHVESTDDAEFAERLAALAERLALARQEYVASRERNDAIVGELEELGVDE